MNYRSANRGISVLIVLALLSVTLAVSYAMMRSQFTSSQIQENYQRRADARLAAYTGLSIAFQNMQSASWQGVGTTLVRNLGSDQSCRITFQTGDPSLAPSHPDYAQYPYRVTVVSTGFITDPRSSVIVASHSVRSVVQLVRRKLNDAPSGWTGVQPYTLYQWGAETGDGINIDVPARIEGPIRAHNVVAVGEDYPGDGDNVPFAGQIDEVAIFNRALSSAHIAFLAAQFATVGNFGQDSDLRPFARWRLNEASGALLAADSWGSQHGVLDGATLGASPVPFHGGTSSAVFDGWTDQIHIPQVPINGNEITILAWFKPSSLSANAHIVSKAIGPNESDHLWSVETYSTGSNHRLRFRIYTSSGGADTLNASSGNLTAGSWVFVAAVYDRDTMRLYKDGQLVGTRSKSGSMPNLSTWPASIGNNPGGNPRARLFRDLNRRRLASGQDHRPLTGPIHAPAEKTPAMMRSLLQDELQLSWTETTGNSAPVSHPGELQSYRLYPGGAPYRVTSVESPLRNVTLTPDPVNNPLGICFCNGPLAIRENVNLQGAIIVHGDDPDVEIQGTNISLQPTSLPPTEGSLIGHQLPTILARDDVRINQGATGTVNGIVAAWGECRFETGSQAETFSINGKVIAKTFSMDARTEWDQSTEWWKWQNITFLSHLTSANPLPYFQSWLQVHRGLDATPRLTVAADPTSPAYHWPQWDSPIFVAAPSDGGLRWDVLDISEVN